MGIQRRGHRFDTSNMTPLALDLRHQPRVREIRCECAVCGTHTTGWQVYSLSAECGNCGSYDMRPVPVSPPVAPWVRAAA
jgi:hypothetical protein